MGDLNIYSDDDDEFPQQLRIVKVIRHQQHRFSAKYYDVALMQLEKNITWEIKPGYKTAQHIITVLLVGFLLKTSSQYLFSFRTRVHETVAPACLWLDDEVRFPKLYAAGWGRTGFGEWMSQSARDNPAKRAINSNDHVV